MTTVADLQKAILSLSDSEYAELRNWLIYEDSERWDRELEEDAKAGRLDALAASIFKAKEEGNLTPL